MAVIVWEAGSDLCGRAPLLSPVLRSELYGSTGSDLYGGLAVICMGGWL